ncbi:MAG: phage neck terminator protein [Fusobacteriaceae bacterium]
MDIRKMTKDLIKEISPLCIDVQLINGADLNRIPEAQLKFPRLMLDFVGYNEAGYDYTKETYNKIDDTLDLEREVISSMSYRFRIYNDSKNNIDIANIIHKIHRFYSNLYVAKLNGEIQVTGTGSIINISSGVDDDYTLGYQFELVFNVSEIDIARKIDYATSFGTLIINNNDKQEV